MTITELKQKRAAALDKAKSIQGAAEAEDRELTDEQMKKVEAYISEADGIDAQVKEADRRLGVFQKLSKDHNALSQIDPVKAGAAVGTRVEVSDPGWKKDPKKGFERERDFYMAVMRTGMGHKAPENLDYLRVRATVGSDEQAEYSDPHGGFLVPEGFSSMMLETADPESDPIAGLTTKVPMDSPIIKIPARVDKDHSTSVSGGLQVYRRAEADTVPAGRMKFELVRLEAHSLLGIAYATEELLRDSPRSIAALVSTGFNAEIKSKLMAERLYGTGVGEYMGVLNSANPALITVSKEVGQDADTITFGNILAMRTRIWHYQQAVWVMTQDAIPQLATIADEGGAHIFLGSAREDVGDTLMGRPIVYVEDAAALGDLGDISLINWSQYLEGELQPLDTAESIHVRFEYLERAYRFWTRNDGAPWWKSVLTPKHGSTKSPFVTLEAR